MTWLSSVCPMRFSIHCPHRLWNNVHFYNRVGGRTKKPHQVVTEMLLNWSIKLNWRCSILLYGNYWIRNRLWLSLINLILPKKNVSLVWYCFNWILFYLNPQTATLIIKYIQAYLGTQQLRQGLVYSLIIIMLLIVNSLPLTAFNWIHHHWPKQWSFRKSNMIEDYTQVHERHEFHNRKDAEEASERNIEMGTLAFLIDRRGTRTRQPTNCYRLLSSINWWLLVTTTTTTTAKNSGV